MNEDERAARLDRLNAMARRMGLGTSPEQEWVVSEALGYVERYLACIHRKRSISVEPAHVVRLGRLGRD